MFDIQSADIKTNYAELIAMIQIKYLNRKLDEAETAASDPKTKWLEHEEFWRLIGW